MEEPQLLQPSQGDQPKQEKPVVPAKNKLSKREIVLIVFVILAVVGAGAYAWVTGKNKEASINSFAECKAAGNPIMESYPEQCAANGQTWSNPDQIAPELPGEEGSSDKSGFDTESEHITDIEGGDGMLLADAADADKLPGATDSFKSYIKLRIQESSKPVDGCRVVYQVNRVSAVNVSGDARTVGANGESDDNCGGGAGAIWYIKDGEWNEDIRQDNYTCAEMEKMPIYSEFIPQCWQQNDDPNAALEQKANPNGSIDEVL